MVKYQLKILFLSMLLCSPAGIRAGIHVTLADELAPLYPDMSIEKPVLEYSTDAARGTIAAVHVMITGLEPGSRVEFQLAGADGIVFPSASWYRMIDVPVQENTGLDSRTEQFTGQTNPYVIRRAPFRIYEAFEPIDSSIEAAASSLGLRVEIPVGTNLKTGLNSYTIEIGTGSWKRTLIYSIRVFNATVPSIEQAAIRYVNWHSNQIIAKDHWVEIWSEPFWKVLQNYAKMMAKGRQNTFWFIWSDFFEYNPDGTLAGFKRDRLERYIKTFLNEGLTTIQGAPFCRRRDWNSDAFLVSVPTEVSIEIPATSDMGKRIIRDMAIKVASVMQKNEWESRWVQGIFDEPTEEYVERYKAVAEVLRDVKCDIRILEATMTMDLMGVVDCWCPQVQEYQANMEFFENRKKAGDDVWVYTCLIPGGPWINRLLDQERLRPVYVGWACAKYDLQGFLHWGFNHHGENAYEDLIRNNGGPKNFLPAGDSHIVYPGNSSPLSSQRYEAHRIGMEDYELLVQLKGNNPELADELINRLFQSFNEYCRDIAEYRMVKAELLKSL